MQSHHSSDVHLCWEIVLIIALSYGLTAELYGLTDYSGLQVDEDAARHVLAGPSLAEEGVEGVIPASDGLVAGHLTVGLDAVLQAVQLPAGVAHLHAGLPHMD